MAAFIKLEGTLAADSENALAEALSPLPVLGIQLHPAGDGVARAEIWLSVADAGNTEEIRKVLRGLGTHDLCVTEHAAEDWAGRWRASLHPFPVGAAWWIDPHPDRGTRVPPGRWRLAVEPRAAFGSGTHETTQLVLVELEAVGCRGRRVLDVGTGSGILAIAADRLDAASVVAVDIDPIAAWEALRTAGCQDWRCRIRAVAGGVECCRSGAFDLVLANMIRSELVPILDDIHRVLAIGGEVVMAGLLESERRAMESSLAGSGLEVTGGRRLGEWVSLVAVRLGGRA